MKPERRWFLKDVGLAGAGWCIGSALPVQSAESRWSLARTDRREILCAADAPEPLRFAAAELEKYLSMILGPANPGPQRPRSRRILLELGGDNDLGDESFEISSHDDRLRIAGGAAGVAYGVFEFLRRYAGCQFSGPGPDCEYVPSRARIDFPGMPLRMKPQLWYRGFQYTGPAPTDLTMQHLDWMVKNGLNYVMFMPRWSTAQRSNDHGERIDELTFRRHIQPQVLQRGLKLDCNHHNLFYWLPPERYFDQHPDWYALVDGKRVVQSKQLAICTTNEEAVATLVENVKTYLRGNPRVKIVGVVPEDGYGMCQCDACLKSDPNREDAFRAAGGYKSPEGENKSKAVRYARLVNRVAREIRGEFPDVRVGHAAYVDLQWPPRGVTLEPNIVTWVALYWRDAAHPMAHDSRSAVNRFFFDILEQWKAVHPGRIIVYEYYVGMSSQRTLPYPMAEVVCREWPNLKKLGIEGATIQCGPSIHNSYGLSNLAFARSGWQDQVDYESLLNDYLLGMFGAAAPEVKPVFAGFGRALKRVEEEGPTGSIFLSGYDPAKTTRGSFLPDGHNVGYLLEYLGPGVLEKALAGARAKAVNDRERRQVETLTTMAGYWRKAADAFLPEMRGLQAEKDGNLASAISFYKQSVELQRQALAYLGDHSPRGWVTPSPYIWELHITNLDKRIQALSRKLL
ncbi:MAG TPA: DUF4838 domain-containing protein [Bryobacteraceae bacterium]|nr:DUF4838 domain-containing protein [Bryobacteraceae bacterium]